MIKPLEMLHKKEEKLRIKKLLMLLKLRPKESQLLDLEMMVLLKKTIKLRHHSAHQSSRVCAEITIVIEFTPNNI